MKKKNPLPMYRRGLLKNRTKAEIRFASLLDEIGIRYEEQVIFGRSIADFYLPDYKTIIE